MRGALCLWKPSSKDAQAPGDPPRAGDRLDADFGGAHTACWLLCAAVLMCLATSTFMEMKSRSGMFSRIPRRPFAFPGDPYLQ